MRLDHQLIARRRLSSMLVAGLLWSILGAGCRKEPPRRDAVSTRSPTPTEPEPIPREPPFGPLSVPDAGIPCDVDAVLAAKCRRCHTTPVRNSAPFALLTWEDLTQSFHDEPLPPQLARVVKSGFMPYQIPANPPVVPLTEEEKQTLVNWVEKGALRESCDPNALPQPVGKKQDAPKKKPRRSTNGAASAEQSGPARAPVPKL